MAGVLREQFIGSAGVLDEQAPSPSVTASLSGVQATAQRGALTASGSALVLMAGVQAVSQSGNVSVSASALAVLAGVAGAFASGLIAGYEKAPDNTLSVRRIALPRDRKTVLVRLAG